MTPCVRKVVMAATLLCVLVPHVGLADDSGAAWNFKTAKANDALRKYQAARKKLDDSYQKSCKDNRESLVGKLQEQVSAATKAGKLDEALAIREVIKLLRDADHSDSVPQDAANQAVAKGDFLDDLPEGPIKVRGQLGKHGRNQLNAAVTVQGAPIQHSLCTHPDPNSFAVVSYNIQGSKYQTFSGSVAIADYDIAKADALDGTTIRTPLTFKIFGDKKLIWSSKPVVLPGVSQPFKVNIRHVRNLYLRVECPGAHGYRFAMWVDPMLTK